MQIMPIGIDTLDHELDIVLDPTGNWFFKDVEKMTGWVELGRFTPDEAEEIRRLASELGQMIDDGKTWWNDRCAWLTESLNQPQSRPEQDCLRGTALRSPLWHRPSHRSLHRARGQPSGTR